MITISKAMNWVVLTLLFTLSLGSTSMLFGQSAEVQKGQPRPDFFLPLSEEVGNSILEGIPLSAGNRQDFLTEGLITLLDKGETAPRLNPLTTASPSIQDAWNQKDSNITIQTLLAYPLPDNLQDLELQEQLLAAYNAFSRFTTMAGIEYWSESRQRMRTFYLESSRINPAFPDRPLPDKTYDQIPPQEFVTLRQRDASFGDNQYKLTFTQHPEGIHATIQNITTMWYSILPVAQPMDVRMDITLTVRGDYLLFFGSARLQAPNIFGIRDRAEDSFYNRIISLYNWFAGQLTEF
jgi:hypothetical protein